MTSRPPDSADNDVEQAIFDTLPDALGALSTEDTPPPGLDARVLTTPPTAPAWWRPVLAVAAGVLLGIGIGGALATTPAHTLTPGRHIVQGPAELKVPGGVLALDGVVYVDLREPGGSVVRAGGHQDPDPRMSPMPTSRDLIAAAAGAGVTFAVVQGTAAWTADGSEATTPIAQGEALTVKAGSAVPKAHQRVVVQTDGPTPTPAAGSRSVAELEDENAQLREELDALTFELKATQGQLAAYGAVATDWPDDLPEGFRPDPFSDWAEELVADIPGYSLAEVDCTEFPCLVVVQADADAPTKADGSVDWKVAAEAMQGENPPGVADGDKTSTGISIMEMDNDGERTGLMVMYTAPEGHIDDSVKGRLEVRTREAAERATDGM